MSRLLDYLTFFTRNVQTFADKHGVLTSENQTTEMQYHKADTPEAARHMAAEALVIRELLKQ